MCGCHRADSSIWALSTILALPISSLHCRSYSRRVLDCDTPDTHTYISLLKRVAGVKPPQGCMHGVCPGTQHFEIKTEMYYF